MHKEEEEKNIVPIATSRDPFQFGFWSIKDENKLQLTGGGVSFLDWIFVWPFA